MNLRSVADEVGRGTRELETNLFKFEVYKPVTPFEQSAMARIYATLAIK